MNKNEITANYDESWKEALNEYFDSFLSLLLNFWIMNQSGMN
jgi:hypothetical protein